MSHFTKLSNASVTDVEAFFKACKAMGMTVREENVEMRAWDRNDKPQQVRYLARFPGEAGAGNWRPSQYGIGLVQGSKPGTWDMMSDWSLTGHFLPQAIKEGIKGWQTFPDKDGPGGGAFAACEALRGRVLRDTLRHAIVDRYARQGFRATVTEDQEQNLNVELVRY